MRLGDMPFAAVERYIGMGFGGCKQCKGDKGAKIASFTSRVAVWAAE